MNKSSDEIEREFLRIFQRLASVHAAWRVWQDFVSMSAISIVDLRGWRPVAQQRREESFQTIAKRYKESERKDFTNLFELTVAALETNPAQDFLGSLYMRLGLSSHWQGQFFTPWSVAELMAKVTAGDSLKERVASEGYISVNDPACGAGCMLIAFANVCLEQGVNYQRSVFFVGQDLDPVAAKMCYIQMSLLGCPGYVVVGNTITEPVAGSVLSPVYKKPENIWYTPMYFSDIWAARR